MNRVRVQFHIANVGRYEDGGFAVYPNSMLFRAGEYPDKDFSISVDDLKRTAAEWSPIHANVEHHEFLNGRAGTIVTTWVDGDTLRGVVKVPLGLDQLMTDHERGVSLEFDRGAKKPIAWALTTNPRVTDAALMSAVGIDNRSGGTAIDKPDDPARASRARGGTMRERLMALLRALFAKGTESPATDEEIRAIFADVKFSDETATTPPTSPPITDPALAAQFSLMQAEITRLHVANTRAAADAWFDQHIRHGKVLPAERTSMVAMFCQATADDNATPAVVTFSEDGKTGGRVDTLRAMIEARIVNPLLTTFPADPAQFRVLDKPAEDNPTELTEVRRKGLLRHTETGRDILARR